MLCILRPLHVDFVDNVYVSDDALEYEADAAPVQRLPVLAGETSHQLPPSDLHNRPHLHSRRAI